MGNYDGVEILGVSLLVAIVLFFGIIIGTVIGFVTGWVIGVTPLAWHVEKGFAVFGINARGLLPQVGAVIGFVTGFLSSLLRTEKNSD